MLDSASLWLPGLAPSDTPVVAAPPVVVPTAHLKPLASATVSYLRPRNVWPAAPAGLWDRDFSPLKRLEGNFEAVKVAASLSDGQAPSDKQRDALNLFNGWGALSKLFDHLPPASWIAARDGLEAIVGEEGMEAIRESTTTSFFTPPAIVRAVWDALAKAGFAGGNILEPSAGHGMFLANMPEEMAKRSQVTAIEPEHASAMVLKALYGHYGVNVKRSTFEEASLPEGFYDAVVTNVPFGDFGVGERRNVPYRNFLIHDYFIARALDVVRPGGLVAVVTSSGTMDKISSKVRRYLGSKARLLQAVRLPVDAFESFAGTSPVTDVLVFQRLAAGIESNIDEWEESCSIRMESALVGKSLREQLRFEHNGSRYRINQWYVNQPQSVLGKLEAERGPYGYSAVPRSPGGEWVTGLAEKLSELEADTYRPFVAERPRTVEIVTGLRPGSFALDSTGAICVVEGPGVAMTIAGMSVTATQRVRGLIALRDEALALLQAQGVTENDAELEQQRVAFSATYDAFVKAHGIINSTANTRAFAGDPSLPMLQALEVSGEKGCWEKAPIFSRRTVRYVAPIEHCDTAEEALQASLALYGRVDAGWMATATGMDSGKLMQDLAESGVVFRDPKTMAWETRDAYLSGDVRLKLREAEVAGSQWSENVEALRQVVPADLEPCDIKAVLGSTWIPVPVYEAFGKEFFGADLTIESDLVTGSWSVTCLHRHQIRANVHSAYGVLGKLSPVDLMEKAMNRQEPTVTDPHPNDSRKRVINQIKTIEAREKQEALGEQFVKWLWSNTERSAKLARIYNDTFNCVVNRTYDGSNMTMPGFSSQYTLYPHQLNAIWRVVTSPNSTMLAHRVGFGKSLEMICSGMELRRVGAASKIAYVVPNATFGDFVKEFVRAYPAANLLIATEKEFTGAKRRQFLARAATGDWDGVIITHTMFERIRISEEGRQEFIEREMSMIDGAIAASQQGGSQLAVKQLERLRAKWLARLTKNANRKGDQDDCLSFEDVGFDWLMVDEAHYFKNLYRFSKMERVAGLPDSDAERAFDMFLKCRLVAQRQGGRRGIVFATGTPVANSMGELFTMQRFLQPDDLARVGADAFDSWASNFGQVVTALEVAPDGSGYRMNRRFSRFVNIPELMTIFREVADIQVGDPPYLKLPQFERDTMAASPSLLVKEYVQTLVARAEKVRNGHVKPEEDNMLSITGDGRKAALDMRLIDPTAPDDPDGKVNQCVRNVLTIWRETAAERLAQVIFSDMGTPSTERFSVYADIKRKLVAAGVPEAEIAFAHDAATHAARASMSEAIREGRVRIAIGSTQKLGVGVNMQTRLVALHHLDAPWRPADIEQREGRIVRQGNSNDAVRIFRYVTSGTFDAYMWQTLETKAKFIAQIMAGDMSIRTAEDLELASLSYAEVKALATGNPMVIEKAGVDAEVAKLSALRSAHMDALMYARRQVDQIPRNIEWLSRRKAGLECDAKALASMAARVLSVRGQQIGDPAKMGEAIHHAAVSRLYIGSAPAVVGMIGSLQLSVKKRALGKGYVLSIEGEGTLSVDYDGAELAAKNALDRLLDPSGIEEAIAKMDAELKWLNEKLVQYQGEGAPFAQEARYRELLARQSEIEEALGIADGVYTLAEAA